MCSSDLHSVYSAVCVAFRLEKYWDAQRLMNQTAGIQAEAPWTVEQAVEMLQKCKEAG